MHTLLPTLTTQEELKQMERLGWVNHQINSEDDVHFSESPQKMAWKNHLEIRLSRQEYYPSAILIKNALNLNCKRIVWITHGSSVMVFNKSGNHPLDF